MAERRQRNPAALELTTGMTPGGGGTAVAGGSLEEAPGATTEHETSRLLSSISTDEGNDELIPNGGGGPPTTRPSSSHKVGPSSGFFNILKSCLGVGILATPAAFSRSGWLLGAILLTLAAAISAYGCFLLNACAHRMGGSGDTSFFLLFQRTFPRWGALADILIMIECWGSVVGYIIIVGDDMAELAVQAWGITEGTTFASTNFWRTLIFWGVIAPLTALPNLSMLKYSSSAGLLCVLVYCGVSVLFAALPGRFPACGAEEGGGGGGPSSCKGDVALVHGGFLTSLSLYFFIYGMQMKLFLVYNELREPSIPRLTNLVTSPAVALALVVILLTSLPAYFTYGNNVADNFLLNYPTEVGLVRVAVLANVWSVTSSGPLTLHPARASAITLINFCASCATGKQPPASDVSPAWHRRVWVGSTVALLIGTFVPGLVVKSLGKFLALVGAVGGTGLIMWCPGFAFHKLFRDDEERFGCLMDPHDDGSNHTPEPADLTDSSGPLFTRARLSLHLLGARVMGWGGLLLMGVILVVDIISR